MTMNLLCTDAATRGLGQLSLLSGMPITALAAAAIATAPCALDQPALAPHAGAIVGLLADSDEGVLHAASMALGKLDEDALASHAGAIVCMLEDSCELVRYNAVMTLRRIKSAALTPYAGAIVRMLADAHAGVRDAASLTLGQLEPAALASHAGAIVGLLTDPAPFVRCAAMEALGKLERLAPASYAGAIAGLLADPEPFVRCAAMEVLVKLGRSAPASYVGAIVRMLADSIPFVRCEAMRTLGMLERVALASHAGAIADAILNMLVDPNETVRYDALWMFDSDAMGMLEPDVLARACSVVTNMLTDEADGVRDMATNILGNLKRKRSRLHWGTARAFVLVFLVRPYALFWHAYVGEQLCAPGGKWAARDRAAFEEEFCALRQ